jgi:hypothetical protein
MHNNNKIKANSIDLNRQLQRPTSDEIHNICYEPSSPYYQLAYAICYIFELAFAHANSRMEWVIDVTVAQRIHMLRLNALKLTANRTCIKTDDQL